MRDRFEIVHMRDDGSYDVLTRFAPKKSHHRWEATEQLARFIFGGRVARALEAAEDYGLTYAYASVEDPSAGYVGIKEKD